MNAKPCTSKEVAHNLRTNAHADALKYLSVLPPFPGISAEESANGLVGRFTDPKTQAFKAKAFEKEFARFLGQESFLGTAQELDGTKARMFLQTALRLLNVFETEKRRGIVLDSIERMLALAQEANTKDLLPLIAMEIRETRPDFLSPESQRAMGPKIIALREKFNSLFEKAVFTPLKAAFSAEDWDEFVKLRHRYLQLRRWCDHSPRRSADELLADDLPKHKPPFEEVIRALSACADKCEQFVSAAKQYRSANDGRNSQAFLDWAAGKDPAGARQVVAQVLAGAFNLESQMPPPAAEIQAAVAAFRKTTENFSALFVGQTSASEVLSAYTFIPDFLFARAACPFQAIPLADCFKSGVTQAERIQQALNERSTIFHNSYYQGLSPVAAALEQQGINENRISGLAGLTYSVLDRVDDLLKWAGSTAAR